jgi:hypothetical protein
MVTFCPTCRTNIPLADLPYLYLEWSTCPQCQALLHVGASKACAVCGGTGATRADGTIESGVVFELLCGHRLCEPCFLRSRPRCPRCHAHDAPVQEDLPC